MTIARLRQHRGGPPSIAAAADRICEAMVRNLQTSPPLLLYPQPEAIIEQTFPAFVLTFLSNYFPHPDQEPVPTWVQEALQVAGIDVPLHLLGSTAPSPPSPASLAPASSGQRVKEGGTFNGHDCSGRDRPRSGHSRQRQRAEDESRGQRDEVLEEGEERERVATEQQGLEGNVQNINDVVIIAPQEGKDSPGQGSAKRRCTDP